MKVSKLQKQKDNPKSKYWLKQADSRWSEKIREKGECEICHSREYLNASHLIPREVKATRHNLSNGLCLCSTCHKWGMKSFHKNPAFVFIWLRSNKPSQFDWLVHNIGNVSTEDVDYKEQNWYLRNPIPKEEDEIIFQHNNRICPFCDDN